MTSTPSTPDRAHDVGRIVVGVDGSPSSEEALRWGLAQSALTGQPVHAVISWEFPVDYGVAPMGDFDWEANSAAVLSGTVQKVLAEVRPEGPADEVEQHVDRGHPARVLLEAAASAALLVVGSRGHGGFTGMLLGSVSQHVVAHAACPVVVVHRPRADPEQGDAPQAGSPRSSAP
jgi:nucleotide-binding universal stress UspA family protein